MEIIQIVGYKNSGKTTLSTNLIEFFSNKGINVASLKHHGHGGLPLGLEETDSAKHLQAGAVISGVEGDGMFQLTKQKAWKVEDMLDFYRNLDTELVIIEGFKAHHYQKIVLIRNEEDLALLKAVTNIIAIVTSLELKQVDYPYKLFKPTELNLLVKWVTKQFKF